MRPLFHCLIALSFCLTTAGGLRGENLAGQAGPVRTLPIDIQLGIDPADLTIIEGQNGQIAGIGDFNGDGRADILIEYFGGDPLPGVGVVVTRAGIIFGKPDLPPGVVIDLTKTAPDLTIPLSRGIQGGFVHSIGFIGDLNGDRIDELGVAVRLNGRTSLYGFFGSRALGSGLLDLSQTQPDLTVMSPDANVDFGGVIDLNGDGHNDLILRSGSDDSSDGSSSISVLFGPYPSGRVVDLGGAKADVVVVGSSEHDLLTPAAGDVNGDGVQDLLISIVQYPATPRGLAVIYGSATVAGRSPISVLDGQADALVPTPVPVVASCDVNGDRIDDIVVGEPVVISPEGPPFFNDLPGSAGVVFGSKQSLSSSGVNIEGVDLLSNRGTPMAAGDQLGAVIAVRDIDGDGLADVIVGAPAPKLDQLKSDGFPGQVYVVLGSKSLAGTTLRVASIDQDLTIRRAPGTFNHVSLAGSGDFNGDGISDIVVQSFSYSNGAQGTAFIFFGAPLRAPSIDSARLQGSQLVLSGSDFNGRTRLEVNGAVLEEKAVFDRDKNKLTFAGSAQDLGFHPGRNKVAVVRGTARSNTIKVRL